MDKDKKQEMFFYMAFFSLFVGLVGWWFAGDNLLANLKTVQGALYAVVCILSFVVETILDYKEKKQIYRVIAGLPFLVCLYLLILPPSTDEKLLLSELYSNTMESISPFFYGMTGLIKPFFSEAYFNSERANNIQLLSLPLEIVGLVLVVIETLRPDVADQIERWFDNLIAIRLASNKWFACSLIVISLYALWMREYYPALPMTEMVVSLMLAFITLVNFKTAINALDNLTGGKALGGIGIIMAFVGVCGEVYQVTTIAIEKGWV